MEDPLAAAKREFAEETGVAMRRDESVWTDHHSWLYLFAEDYTTPRTPAGGGASPNWYRMESMTPRRFLALEYAPRMNVLTLRLVVLTVALGVAQGQQPTSRPTPSEKL